MASALFFLCFTFTLVMGLSGCEKGQPDAPKPYERFQEGEDMPGGNASVSVSGFNSFALPSANMPVSSRMEFHSGNSFFRQPWEPAPGENTSRDGLGPLMNTNTCEKCHIRDGRGHAPKHGALNDISLLVRLSIPAITDEHQSRLIQQGVIPEPTYGGQLQDRAIPGVAPEGKVRVNYRYSTVSFADGFKVELRKPVLTIESLGYGPLHENVMMSARLTPSMIGIGLLEAISEQRLLDNTDPEDADGDGISGRANRVWDVQKQKTSVGRFGWKAGVPTLRQQSAAAFNGDMGLTTSLFPHEPCTERQTLCQRVVHKGAKGETQKASSDVSDLILEKVVFYSRNLGVPIRHDAKHPEVLKGKKLFNEAGCTQCHTPSFRTASMASQSETAMTVIEQEQANQLIWPYSDFLLHDMGDELADGRPEFLATGNEWRTPPLWGIGHSQAVNKKAGFLHDGRARTLVEALLWHGGEATESKNNVLKMHSGQRKALFRFIESL